MKNPPAKEDDYLWDGSGEPDPEVVRLESLLAPLRHRRSAPALPARSRRIAPLVIRWMLPAVSAAAVLLLAAAAAWVLYGMTRSGWSVQSIAGAPVVDGAPLSGGARGDAVAAGKTARLGVGEWLVTDGVSRARIAVGQIGRVDVEPNTRVQLVEARGREHRMSLTRGTIHARIWAPPRFFYVNTPSAVAIDLGCEYTLQVDDTGAGLIRVTSGWVGFQSDGRESFVPEGAMCATRPGVGPGTPRYEDAPSGYAEALALLDFGRPDDPRRAAAFDLVVSTARRRDALTLWHLLARGTPEERARVFDRLATLAPPPAGITRDAVLRGDRGALDQWWDGLGLSGTWWKLFKKKLVAPDAR
jgi:hypothetical protein